MMHRQSKAARASLVEIQLAVLWPLGVSEGSEAGDASRLSFESVVGVAEKTPIHLGREKMPVNCISPLLGTTRGRPSGKGA